MEASTQIQRCHSQSGVLLFVINPALWIKAGSTNQLFTKGHDSSIQVHWWRGNCDNDGGAGWWLGVAGCYGTASMRGCIHIIRASVDLGRVMLSPPPPSHITPDNPPPPRALHPLGILFTRLDHPLPGQHRHRPRLCPYYGPISGDICSWYHLWRQHPPAWCHYTT